MLKDFVKQLQPLPRNTKLLILGAGFSGQHVARLAKALGADVVCSRRHANSPGADIAFDSSREQLPSKEAWKGITHLLSCIPPDLEGKDPVLNSLQGELERICIFLKLLYVFHFIKENWFLLVKGA